MHHSAATPTATAASTMILILLNIIVGGVLQVLATIPWGLYTYVKRSKYERSII
jgi:hypothetical protein